MGKKYQLSLMESDHKINAVKARQYYQILDW